MTSEPAASSSDRTAQADALAQFAFLVTGLLDKHAGANGLSMVQTRLLGVLRDRTPTMNELARILGLDKSSTTGLVARAERRGLVARRPSPTDGRSFLVHLSDAGRGLVEEAEAQYEADVAEVLAPLPRTVRDGLFDAVGRLLAAEAGRRDIELVP